MTDTKGCFVSLRQAWMACGTAVWTGQADVEQFDSVQSGDRMGEAWCLAMFRAVADVTRK